MHSYKATRVDRWSNLQPCVGDCKVEVIPNRHTKEVKMLGDGIYGTERQLFR